MSRCTANTIKTGEIHVDCYVMFLVLIADLTSGMEKVHFEFQEIHEQLR